MNSPIGVFDSGLGGLTVMKEITKILPNEDIIYFGDTAHVPYGNKSKATIQRFSLEIARFLMQHKIKMLVVACNTASSYAVKTLRKNFSIPIIGVVEPGVTAAIKASRSSRIGVIGTKGTISSDAYQNRLLNIDKSIKVYAKPCPLFVPLVEEGWLNNKIVYEIAEYYLKDFRTKNIDTLILGCTHYPLLKNVIAKIMGKDVTIVDSAKQTAYRVNEMLKKSDLVANKRRKSIYKFYVSDDANKFKVNGGKFFGREIANVKKISLDEHLQK